MKWLRPVIALAGAAALIPASHLARHPVAHRRAGEPGMGSRALRIALEPLQGIAIPFYWLATGAAIARQDAERALQYGRKLLFLSPADAALWCDLVAYLSQGAVKPLLEQSPPLVEDASHRIESALELGLEALERQGHRECLAILATIYWELEHDYHGDYGLRRRYIRIHGESPAATLARLVARHGGL